MLAESDDAARNDAQRTPGANAMNDTRRRVRLADLLQGQRQLIIVHEGEDYRLRITSKGRLILTK